MSLEIEYKNRMDGKGHFFDADTMDFFKSRIGLVRLKGNDWFFTTSEKPPHGDRMFSVRKMDIKGNIQTIGDFCSMTRYQAEKLLKELTSL